MILRESTAIHVLIESIPLDESPTMGTLTGATASTIYYATLSEMTRVRALIVLFGCIFVKGQMGPPP